MASMALIICSSCGQSDVSEQGSLLGPAIATPVAITAQPDPEEVETKIQVAILLDTSGSMNGLLEQAKNQLWKIVNQLAKAKDKYGNDPMIELGLYQYGNDGLPITNGYIEKISEFTTELDEISEQLFALNTNGGSEYCGTVIKSSLSDLKWSESIDDMKVIFIAGNEEFTQGAISRAKAFKKQLYSLINFYSLCQKPLSFSCFSS